jgi:hypothetical protein
MEGIFVPLSFFLTVFAVLYIFWTTRTRERLALIEKGLDASIFSGDEKNGQKSSRYSGMKWGIFLVAVGLGVLLGYMLSNAINEVAAYFSMIILCGGVGLIVAQVVTLKLSKKE